MDDRHARARGLCQVSMSDAKRVIYDARASWGCVRMGCAHDGMGRETATRAPGQRSSRRAIATCATRHAKEKRRGEK